MACMEWFCCEPGCNWEDQNNTAMILCCPKCGSVHIQGDFDEDQHRPHPWGDEGE